MLSPRQNKLARVAAISAWKSSDRTRATLEARFRADSRIARLDPATILLLLRIAFLLWNWWRSKKVLKPLPDPIQGEPGYDP
jgi:hypothetical protein